MASYHRVEVVDLILFNCAPINFVLYDVLGSSTQISESCTQEQIRAVKPKDSSIPAQSSVIRNGE